MNASKEERDLGRPGSSLLSQEMAQAGWEEEDSAWKAASGGKVEGKCQRVGTFPLGA